MVNIELAFLHVTGFSSRHHVLTVLLKVWETNPQPRHRVRVALLADVIRHRPVVLMPHCNLYQISRMGTS